MPKISFSLHNEKLSSGDRKNNFHFVTINFYYFWKKYLGTFFCSINILQMTTNLVPKSSDIFVCEICDYVTSRKSQYERHLSTPKHKNTTNTTINTTKSSNSFICDCGKEYKHHSSLWNHKKKCTPNNETENNNNQEVQELKEFMKYLMKENSEMKNMMLEVIKNGTHNNINNVNSHNKSFNLQFFLNETCKDAMNITDFVDSIKLQLSDLENVGELGYVNGISNIIVKNLNELDVTKRPVHCTDKKRETLYVKDEDKWEKDEEKKKLRKVIKRVASKNQRLLLKFKEVHPDCNTSSSKYSDQYNTIIVESMGGSGDNDLEKEEKIMRNVLKQIVIEKNM